MHGTWYEVLNNKIEAVALDPITHNWWGFASVMSAWNGAAFDTKRNWLLLGKCAVGTETMREMKFMLVIWIVLSGLESGSQLRMIKSPQDRWLMILMTIEIHHLSIPITDRSMNLILMFYGFKVDQEGDWFIQQQQHGVSILAIAHGRSWRIYHQGRTIMVHFLLIILRVVK